MYFDPIPYKKELNIVHFYTAFTSEYHKDYFFPGERHDFWEIVYVVEGKASIVAEKTGYFLSKGDIIFHKPMEFHAIAGDKQTNFKVLIITFAAEQSDMSFFTIRFLH